MKRFFNLIVICSLALFLFSCTSDPVSNSITQSTNFKYPFAANSFWYYSTRNFITNIRGDSVASLYATDTTLGYGNASLSNDTIVYNILTNNYDTLRILRNTHTIGKHVHEAIELYKQTDTGLIRVAYISEGTILGPYRSNQNSITFFFRENYFNSIQEIFEYYRNNRIANRNWDSVLSFDDPPLTCLKYPLEPNTEWYFTNLGTTKFSKKYVEYETVNLSSGSFFCMKIRRFWFLNNSPTPDSNIIMYDYFAKEGMVKKDALFKDIAVLNLSGELLGYFDAKEEANLNIYILP